MIVCERCGREASVRREERFLCASCALKRAQMGMSVLADLIEGYAGAVGAFLDGSREDAASAARRVAQEAVRRQAGPLDLAILHQAAVGVAFRDRGAPEELVHEIQRTAGVLVELLAPVTEEVARLRRITSSLEEAYRRRSAELVETTRRLRETSLGLRRAARDRRGLLRRLVAVREEERRRLAFDLHDEALQVIVGARMRIRALCRHAQDPDVLRLARWTEEALSRCVERLRMSMLELRSDIAGRGGLEIAVRDYLERSRSLFGLDYGFESRLVGEPPEAVSAVIFRVVVEAVWNVRQHARASRVDVRLEEGRGRVTVTVRDDGQGFAVPPASSEPGHLGLLSMRERVAEAGGMLAIESAPGHGTTVRFWVPLAVGRTADGVIRVSSEPARVPDAGGGASGRVWTAAGGPSGTGSVSTAGGAGDPSDQRGAAVGVEDGSVR
ncbi:MAG TPA: sensor histidine kinase [Actinomycetota bacterium]|nr:sensor histidine kinase [Actinomycetota bacterium]